MSERRLTEKDKRAWAAATRNVAPMSGKPVRSRRATHPDDDSSAHPPQQASKKALSAPQNRQNERAVRRGKAPVSASFDLHGHTRESAFRVLPAFLERERARGGQCVIVITGKGKSGEGVLRRAFVDWLERPEARALISGYAPAHARHGGNGAWYVFLRRR